MKTIQIILTILVLIMFIPLNAQEKDMPYWEITQFHVDRAKLDSLKTLETKYYSKIVEQAKKMGLIMDSVLLIMRTGDMEYNVIEINKVSSWEKLDFLWEDAFKIVEPNKEKRDKVHAAYRWLFEGKERKSAIYYPAAEYYY